MVLDLLLRITLIAREGKAAAATTWVTLFSYQQGIFYVHYPTDRISHTMTFVTPVIEHWLEWEITEWAPYA